MCQAFDGERNFLIAMELRELREKARKHESGEQPLTDEEIEHLGIRHLMLNEQ